MRIDENEFFRKTAMEICGNLEVHESMFHLLRTLSRYMPADAISLHLAEVGLESLRRIAVATATESRRADDLLHLSKEAVRLLKEDALPHIRIANTPEDDPFIRDAFTAFELQYPDEYNKERAEFGEIWDSSVMAMFLTNQGRRLGSVSLLARGRGRYKEEHLKLFSLLHDPFVIALSNALRHRELQQLRDTLRDENLYLRQELLNMSGTHIIGANLGLKRVTEMLQHIAPLDSPVILQGETGVGKEVFANAIHHASPRRDQAFVKMNCGAIPENLIDSELFGHEKGAFTGASAQKRGRFERADKGSILLDEIGELSLQAQVRLLRAVQTGEIDRIGGTKAIPVDVRIIAATNRKLEDLVESGRFREDLWYRLNVFSITIPPLRERKEDLPLLLEHFIETKSRLLGIHPVPPVGYGAIDRLTAYNWPGNIRELENVIERELVLSKGGTLMFDHSFLPGTEAPDTANNGPGPVSTKLDDAITYHIENVLRMTNGRIHGPGGAAELLDVKSGTLRYRMDKLGIEYRKNKSRSTR